MKTTITTFLLLAISLTTAAYGAPKAGFMISREWLHA